MYSFSFSNPSDRKSNFSVFLYLVLFSIFAACCQTGESVSLLAKALVLCFLMLVIRDVFFICLCFVHVSIGFCFVLAMKLVSKRLCFQRLDLIESLSL